jgi:streptogramin lyase
MMAIAFTPYVHDNLNPHSLAANYVESIYADSNGIIWVGTSEAGLDRLDPETGIFTHFLMMLKFPPVLAMKM